MTHSGMLHKLDISTFCLYELLLFQIFISWKFIKTLGFTLSTFIFTVNSHADNYFYKYNYLFHIVQ